MPQNQKNFTPIKPLESSIMMHEEEELQHHISKLRTKCNKVHSHQEGFIHCKIAKELNSFLYTRPDCQVMVANGGTINCSKKCHNINLTMGEYVLNSTILSIPMGGADVVLRV